MAAAVQNDFQRGDDFISFGAFSPPSEIPSAEAGPSRLPATGTGLSDRDQAILSAKTGRRGDPAPVLPNQTKKGKGKGKEKANGADAAGQKKQKGKGKAEGNGLGAGAGPKNLKEERRAAERHAPWTDLVDWDACRDPADMLNAEIDAFYRYVSPTQAEFEVRLFTIELITRAVMRLWPDAEITPFGSWQTQLYLPSGDIDLVVNTKRLNENNKGKLLGDLARAMRSANVTSVVAIIAKARVPIIKFVTLEGKLNVDISLNQSNGVSAGQIINQYLDVLPGSRQLILVVKAFLSQRSMNEVYTGGLGSYAVICLVISFLQLHPKLRRASIDPEDNLGTLLIEFFELYGRNFYYDEVGISIRRGGSYFKKRTRGWARPGQPFLLSIEDPQDTDNDISGGSFGIRQVKNCLAGAYEMLQARLFERAEQISGRRSGRYDDEWDPEQMSILTGIMGITKETQKHRQELRRLHQEGRLQRMLSIPPKARPEDYVQNFRPPPVVGVKRSAGTIRLGGDGPGVNGPRRHHDRDDDEDGAPQPLAKRTKYANGSGLGAVMLDDADSDVGLESAESEEEEEEEEEDDDDDDDDEEDEVEEGEEPERGQSAAGRRPAQKRGAPGSDVTGVRAVRTNSGSEDGEIIEISSDDAPAPFKRSRLESVSHDEDEYLYKDQAGATVSRLGRPGDADEESASRYAAPRPKRRITPRTPGRRMSANGEEDELDSDSSSDSSIVPLSRPPSATQRQRERPAKPNGAKGPVPMTAAESSTPVETMSVVPRDAEDPSRLGSTSATAGLGPAKGSGSGSAVPSMPSLMRQARRDFWAAKGKSADESDMVDKDDFGDGTDYVGL